jgi:hypothetical protein
VIRLTDHAIERFRERVRPDLTPALAKAEIERLVVDAGEPSFERPWPSLRGGRRYLPIAFGVALSLQVPTRGDRRHLVATTCVTNEAYRVVRR